MRNKVLVIMVLLIAVPATAQEEPLKNTFFSAGVSFNEDSIGFGGGIYSTGVNNVIGLYGNVFIDVTAPVDDNDIQDQDVFPWHTAEESKYEYKVFNGGLAFRTSKQMVLYVGGGLVVEKTVTRYTDTSNGGEFWVWETDHEFNGNFNAGFILLATSSLGVDAGFNSAPKGGYVNVAINF